MLYPPTGTLPITLCGQELWLLPSRALLWPRRRLMVFAGLRVDQALSDDQKAGAQTMSADTQRFVRLIERLQPQRLVALGPAFCTQERPATGAVESEVVDWVRRTFSGRLDVVRSDMEKGASSIQRLGEPPHRLQKTPGEQFPRWTDGVKIGPFFFREWCGHAEPDTTEGASCIIAAQREEGRQTASRTTDPPHFCLLEDCLLLAPFSDATPHAHRAECHGHRAAIVDGKVAWET
jgi:hypothetical protein